jgi:hypothetical protein
MKTVWLNQIDDREENTKYISNFGSFAMHPKSRDDKEITVSSNHHSFSEHWPMVALFFF